MIRFESASNGLVDTAQAVRAAISSAASGQDLRACRLVVFHLTMGHDLDVAAAEVAAACPGARVLGSTCAGVIGREGANESMRAFAVMLCFGEPGELSMAMVPELDGATSYEGGARLGRMLQDQAGPPAFVMLMASGIDIDTQATMAGIEDALGPHVTIFGGTSADNMKGIASYQVADGQVYEHAAVLVGFHDPSLRVVTQASHGFVPTGVELVVEEATGNRVHRLSGGPAWEVYTRALGLPPSATPGDTIPPGAVGVALSPALAAEYGDTHLLRVITRKLDDGTLLMPVGCEVGTRLALMRRDEDRIFGNLDVMLRQLGAAVGGDEIVGVFHADCGARGRLTLDRVAKEEIVQAMQTPLHQGHQCPAWLGLYGFGEFARLGGRNTFHNYTTALYVICRS